MNISLQPTDVTVNQSHYAVFNCSYNCRNLPSHSIVWSVGGLPERFFAGTLASGFIDRSGLFVEIEDMSVTTCANGGQRAIEQLRINASSAALYNRTAVQCIALPTGGGITTFYSAYSIMLINAPNGELYVYMYNYVKTHIVPTSQISPLRLSYLFSESCTPCSYS